MTVCRQYSANRALIMLKFTNCPTAQHNPNPDIKHFKAERWCSSYCDMENILINLGLLRAKAATAFSAS